MLQALLADRFKLVLHKDTSRSRLTPSYPARSRNSKRPRAPRQRAVTRNRERQAAPMAARESWLPAAWRGAEMPLP